MHLHLDLGSTRSSWQAVLTLAMPNSPCSLSISKCTRLRSHGPNIIDWSWGIFVQVKHIIAFRNWDTSCVFHGTCTHKMKLYVMYIGYKLPIIASSGLCGTDTDTDTDTGTATVMRAYLKKAWHEHIMTRVLHINLF